MSGIHEFAGSDFEGQRVALRMSSVTGLAQASETSTYVRVGSQAYFLRITYDEFLKIWREAGL